MNISCYQPTKSDDRRQVVLRGFIFLHREYNFSRHSQNGTYVWNLPSLQDTLLHNTFIGKCRHQLKEPRALTFWNWHQTSIWPFNFTCQRSIPTFKEPRAFTFWHWQQTSIWTFNFKCQRSTPTFTLSKWLLKKYKQNCE